MEVGAVSATDARDEFLTLLVTQLRNQDPLEPVKQEDFLAQLAQFSTLEGMEKLNSNVEQQIQLQQDLLQMQQVSQAASLISHSVAYAGEDGKLNRGVVDSVMFGDGRFLLRIGGQDVPLNQIVQIGSIPDETSATNSDVPQDSETDTENTENTEPDPAPAPYAPLNERTINNRSSLQFFR